MKSNVVEDRPVVSTVGETQLNFEQLRNKFNLKAARSENFIQGSPKIKSRAFSYWIFMYHLLDVHIRDPVTCFPGGRVQYQVFFYHRICDKML